MLDSNWELINGAPAHHIEQLNATNVINVIEALITLLLEHRGSSSEPLIPNDGALCELHRAGTLFLLKQPGVYRDGPVVVNDGNGNIVHTPPPADEVQGWMDKFYAELRSVWVSGDALDVAAFALWRVNWVHPFKNGNGRTARAFSYACLSAHLGAVLPGTTTVIDQVMATRPRYEAALRAADKVAEKADGRDLSEMKSYLDELLQNQIQSVANQ